MVDAETVLVADSDAERSRQLEEQLFAAGFHVLTAANGVDALRATMGSNPTVVVAHAGLPLVSGLELHGRLAATGLTIPPLIVLVSKDTPVPDESPEEMLLLGTDEPERVVDAVRLVLVARQVSGEFGDSAEVMHGDLTRSSFADLLRVLGRYRVTASVRFSGGEDSGIALVQGSVVDAWRGRLRGRKAFMRLAGLPIGAFTVSLGTPPGVATLEGDLEDLIVAAVEDRLGFHDALSDLPSTDARPEVRVVDGFFSMQFSPVERQTLSRAQQSTTLAELIDGVDAPDLEVTHAVQRLSSVGVLLLHEPADRTHVFTDSTADLTAPDARRSGVGIVSVSIIFGTDVYKDGIDLSPEEFHQRLKTATVLPVTNPATKGEFLETFRQAIISGDILGVLCSSRLSKSYSNAVAAVGEGMDEFRELRRQARVSAEPRIEIVDSGQCSGPLGMMAVLGTRMLRQGVPLREVARRLEQLGTRFRTVLMVRSLDYLRRAGELREARRSREGQRHLLVVREGALEVESSVADVRAAMDRLIELAGEDVDVERPVLASVVHASAPAELADLRARIEARFDVHTVMEHQIGPAVTCHTGPGAVGAAILQPTAEELELFSNS